MNLQLVKGRLGAIVMVNDGSSFEDNQPQSQQNHRYYPWTFDEESFGKKIQAFLIKYMIEKAGQGI